MSLLTTQLDGLLDISRLDAGVVPVDKEAVDLHALLAALVKQEQSAAQHKGLALSIVARLAEQLGIAIRLHSRPGQGTRFTLTLARSSAIAARPQKTGEPLTDRFDLSVLVIDDEKQARIGIRLLLEELGCRCVEAAGADDALALALLQRVLQDVGAPGRERGIGSVA